MASIEVTDDEMMDMALDDIKPTAIAKELEKKVHYATGRVEIKLHGVTVDIVQSVDIAKRLAPAEKGYEIYEHVGDSKYPKTVARAPRVPGNRMHRKQ